MNVKLLKRIIQIIKTKAEVEIDTTSQLEMDGEEKVYYRIYDRYRSSIYIIPEEEFVFDLNKFNRVGNFAIDSITEEIGTSELMLSYSKSEDGKKILENVYSTFDYIMGIPSEKLELFKFKKLAYNKNTKCVTLFEKDWEVVGFIKPNWVEERGDK